GSNLAATWRHRSNASPLQWIAPVGPELIVVRRRDRRRSTIRTGRGKVMTSSGAMSAHYETPTTAEMDSLYESLKNWNRWGADDQRGTLNYLTAERTRAGAAAVRDGAVVSLAHDLGTEASPENPRPAHHHMLASGDAR